jgi:hypothetical protein
VKLRALNEPRPVRVEADARGIPVRVARACTRARDGRPGRRVTAVRETWRIDDEWWRRPISRLYHSVVLENGKSVTLYRDLVDGGWYVQG